MSALAVLWFFLIFVLIAGYFVLDGFDLGVGVLYRALAKDERERALVRRSIGPVWDGNEVWLLTAGGALFAAFPAAYATTFSGFYLAVMLVLFGLIVRAVSLEFRAHDPQWARAWDVCFTVGLAPAGAAAGRGAGQRDRRHPHGSQRRLRGRAAAGPAVAVHPGRGPARPGHVPFGRRRMGGAEGSCRLRRA